MSFSRFLAILCPLFYDYSQFVYRLIAELYFNVDSSNWKLLLSFSFSKPNLYEGKQHMKSLQFLYIFFRNFWIKFFLINLKMFNLIIKLTMREWFRMIRTDSLFKIPASSTSSLFWDPYEVRILHIIDYFYLFELWPEINSRNSFDESSESYFFFCHAANIMLFLFLKKRIIIHIRVHYCFEESSAKIARELAVL